MAGGEISPAPSLRALLQAIALRDDASVDRLLNTAPELATAALAQGATRAEAAEHFLPTLGCYLYEGDTALHIAAAACRGDLVRRLVEAGGSVTARNRRGATPLHHAATGSPEASAWNPNAQAAAIAVLAACGGDPNARDGNGTTPLHRAIRTRSAAAVEALLAAGADATLRTRNGSTPLRLAEVTSGRSGSGSDQAKAQQAKIIQLLQRRRSGA